LEQAPISLGKALEELADFEVISGHGADQGHPFLADVAGDGFLVNLEGEVIAALGGIFVEGPLEEVEGLEDLALELFLAEVEEFGLFAHAYAYLYAYFRTQKPARQQVNFRNSPKWKG
jgi:hypothetical protein